MVPGMDLQTQYDKTLQNTIGQSQRQRNEALRQSQGDVTDWSKRGASGFRGAGFNEVNPSTMPAMDDVTRSNLSPILGTYQEGGQNREGYYGDLNPYTVEGALKYASNVGFTDADTTLQQQAKETGQTLPSIFGHSLANEAARTWGKDYGNWKQQQEQLKQQQTQQQNGGFIPGQDNGDWKWQAGAPQWARMLGGNWMKELSGGLGGNLEGTPEEQWGKDADAFFAAAFPEGSGSWQYTKNGKAIDVPVMEYTPLGGVQMQKQDKLAGSPGSWMPALTMGVLGAMTGGAASGLMGPGAGALGGAVTGAAAGIPAAMQTGLNTGDWGKALGGLGVGAVTGGLTPGLSNVFGDSALGQGVSRAFSGAAGGGLRSLLAGENPMKGIASGAISGGLGSALSSMGNSLNMDKFATNTLSSTISNMAKKKLQGNR